MLSWSNCDKNQRDTQIPWIATLWCVLCSLCWIILFMGQGAAFAQTVDTLRKGVVKLIATADGKQKTGTGFIVRHNAQVTYIVTAAHVVEGDKYPKVTFFSQQHSLIEAEVLKNDLRNDISLLKIRDHTQVPADVETLMFSAEEGMKDNEELIAIGFPAGVDWARVMVALAGKDGLDLVIDRELKEGFSGGPIIKNNKEVIGLITRTSDYGRAIPVEIVAMTLQGWGIAIAVGQNNNASSVTTTKPITDSRLPFEPEMVRIPSGIFLMGSPESESGRKDSESPQHSVTITRPFAVSRYEITVGQFKQFVSETNYRTTAEETGKGCGSWRGLMKKNEQLPELNWKNPWLMQNDDHPVVCVSWNDAQAYVKWLSQRTGARYRLPTEAEWEYVARAGTQTSYWWGDNIGKNNALCSDCGSQWDGKQTAPVGSFKPNPYGVYDTAGNVWEWVEDCWHDNYQDAPTDGSAWQEANGGHCNHRVIRGGSWYLDPQSLRSAGRNRMDSDAANAYLGFRIARTL